MFVKAKCLSFCNIDNKRFLLYIVEHMRELTKSIRLPCDLKAKVKRLASQNGMTSSELVRYSIEAKLPDCEAGRLPANNNDGHKEK